MFPELREPLGSTTCSLRFEASLSELITQPRGDADQLVPLALGKYGVNRVTCGLGSTEQSRGLTGLPPERQCAGETFERPSEQSRFTDTTRPGKAFLLVRTRVVPVAGPL